MFWLHMPYENYSVFKNLKLEKIYMFGYVQNNIVMKALWKFYKMLVYVVANVAIKPN